MKFGSRVTSECHSRDGFEYSARTLPEVANAVVFPVPFSPNRIVHLRRPALSVGEVEHLLRREARTFSNSSERKYDPVVGCVRLAPLGPLGCGFLLFCSDITAFSPLRSGVRNRRLYPNSLVSAL